MSNDATLIICTAFLSAMTYEGVPCSIRFFGYLLRSGCNGNCYLAEQFAIDCILRITLPEFYALTAAAMPPARHSLRPNRRISCRRDGVNCLVDGRPIFRVDGFNRAGRAISHTLCVLITSTVSCCMLFGRIAIPLVSHHAPVNTSILIELAAPLF